MAYEKAKRVYRGIKNIWIVGQAEPEDYFARAKIWNAGDIDKSNGFKTLVDMYNLPISEIEPLDDSLLPSQQQYRHARVLRTKIFFTVQLVPQRQAK